MFLLFVGFSLSNLFRACQGMWRIGTSSTDIRLSECCVGCATLSNWWAVCVQKYGVNMGEYFCEICKFYDYDIKNEQFHCDDCGICRLFFCKMFLKRRQKSLFRNAHVMFLTWKILLVGMH